MGSGAYPLGQQLVRSIKPPRGHILITHTHWDHIQGFPFFAPFFRPGSEWDIYAPRTLGPSLRQALSGQMQHTYFPLELEQFAATIRYHDLIEGRFVIDDVTIDTHYLNHTALTLGYRLQADGASLVFALDHEPYSPDWGTGVGSLTAADQRHIDFVAGADLLVHDVQYTADEYVSKVGWGHSPVDYAITVAGRGRVRHLAMSHHDPQRTDDALGNLVARYKGFAKDLGIELSAASEGTTLILSNLADKKSPREAWTIDHASSTTPAVAGQSVLIVAEDLSRAEVLQTVCETDGVLVSHCTPDELPSAIQSSVPSLILLVMPIGSAGLKQCAEQVSNLSGSSHDPTIGIVHPAENDPSVPLTFRAADRLLEPFSPAYARARLRAWLMRRACRWQRPELAPHESDRLAALRELHVLDRPADEKLTQLVEAARDLFGVQIAAVTLIDEDRQWFGASRGLSVPETPRDESFCAHVVGDPRPLVVPDTLLDDRFADNPAVAGSTRIRSYAGHPLILNSGFCVGTFCVADVKPQHFSEEGLRQLSRFAELATKALEQRAGHTPPFSTAG
jgi:phosphoribosyl 1,2-cyclic phosphodiesterase